MHAINDDEQLYIDKGYLKKDSQLTIVSDTVVHAIVSGLAVYV